MSLSKLLTALGLEESAPESASSDGHGELAEAATPTAAPATATEHNSAPAAPRAALSFAAAAAVRAGIATASAGPPQGADGAALLPAADGGGASSGAGPRRSVTSAAAAGPAPGVLERSLRSLAMGCPAPPLPARLSYHVLIVHDSTCASAAAACGAVTRGLAAAFPGAKVHAPPSTATGGVLAEAVSCAAAVFFFLSRGVLAKGSPAAAAAVAVLRTGGRAVMAHEPDFDNGGYPAFADYIGEAAPEARPVFSLATSVPWLADEDFLPVCGLKLLLAGLMEAAPEEPPAPHFSPPAHAVDAAADGAANEDKKQAEGATGSGGGAPAGGDAAEQHTRGGDASGDVQKEMEKLRARAEAAEKAAAELSLRMALEQKLRAALAGFGDDAD